MYVEFNSGEFCYTFRPCGRYNNLKCYKDGNLYYRCAILDSRIPEESIMLAGKVLKDNHNVGEILDIGTGTGILLLELCRKYGIRKCIGIEIDKYKYDYAIKNIYNNNLEKRCRLFQCSYKDVPSASLSDVRTIVCNPPLIPDELGFWEKNSEECRQPVYENIINWAGKTFNSVGVYLHVFDYIGIIQRTGKYKSLYEIAQNAGFNVQILDSVRKKINISSNVFNKRNYIAQIYPKGIIIKNGTEIQFNQFENETINANESIFLPCSFIYLSKI